MLPLASPGLEQAIAAGVIDRATAERLAPYLAGEAPPPDMADPDDEKLRLVTGFNDIFVTIGLVMFLGALFFLLGPVAGAIAVALASWGLAEFFTAKRRMALPSMVLLVVFVAAVFLAVAGLLNPGLPNDTLSPGQTVVAAAAAAGAALLHWWRFHVPITVAAGVAAVAGLLLALFQMLAPGIFAYPVVVFLPLGLAVFALAMWFDSSDLTRQTRRTDIAFWLHLLAAPLIVHPLLISVVKGDDPLAGAAEVVTVFLCLAAVALVVDRRAILVSSLAYLAYATGKLISAAGLGSASLAMSTLAVGAVVLLLSALWRPLRRFVIGLLPASVRARLPAVA